MTNKMERDPVCGMDVAVEGARWTGEYGGKTWYFCSQGCRTKFLANPEAFPAKTEVEAPGGLVTIGGKAPAKASACCSGHEHHSGATTPVVGSLSGKYTCPMHPEVVKDGPGSCPICGMALEPMVASVDDGPNEELMSMTRRLWVGVALTLPLMAIMALEMLHGNADWMMSRRLGWLELALATPVVLWCGWPFFERGWTSIRTRHLNMFTLIAIGVGAAFLYSLVATLAPGIFPATFRMHGGMVPVYYEAAGVVVLLVFQCRLASNLRASLSRNALVHGDPVQPRRNLRVAAKPAQVAKSREKSLLGGVASVFHAAER